MAWNEPGGSQDQDPWGGRRKTQGPPDLDEIIRKLQQKLSGLFGSKKRSGGTGPTNNSSSSTNLLGLVGALLLAWLAYDCVYIIQPAERGVVLRFGRYVDTLQPGPNVRFPRPIENVIRVNMGQIRTVEIGYRSEGHQSMPVPSEAQMLTQDENIVEIKLAVQYKVKSPDTYLFNDREPDVTLRSAAESAIREMIGKNQMDFVLGEGRSEIAASTKDLLQTILDRYNTGLLVTSVDLQDAQAPEQVQEAFLDAIRAREDQERLINEAQAYVNEVIPKARGDAARMLADANAYKAHVIGTAQGDTSRFSQILQEYQKTPAVTRERMYIETMQSILTNSSKVMVDVQKGNNVLYLPLDRWTTQNLDNNNGSTSPATAPIVATPPSSQDSTQDTTEDSNQDSTQDSAQLRGGRYGSNSRGREVR